MRRARRGEQNVILPRWSDERRHDVAAVVKALVLHAERRGLSTLADPAHAPASTIWADPVLLEEEVPEPQITHPYDVIVHVAVCGVCGSDLHCSQAGPDGYVSFGGPARLPVILGHEFTGAVTRVGNAVTNVAVGDVVTAESIWACWRCDECRAGHLNECRHGELLGLTVNGAFAPSVLVDARHCYSIEPLVRRYGLERALELGALLEPLGVAHRGLTRAGVRADDRIVVVGTGPIGLGIIMLAREAGVTNIVAFDLIDSRVTLAEAAGARAFNVTSLTEFRGGVDAAIRDAFGGQLASLAVEAGGTVEAFDTAFASLENRGRLLVLGRMPTRVPLDTNALLSKALSLIGSRGHAGNDIFRELIDKVTDGSLEPSWLITARFGILQQQEAFAHAREAAGAKTLIRVDA